MIARIRTRVAALFLVALATRVASPLAAQQAAGARLDATVGLSQVRGGTIDFRTGLLADALAAFPIRSTSRGVVVAALGASGIVGGMGDRCLLLPGGGCAGQGNFRVLTALVGIDHALGRGSLRLLAGPSYYSGADARSVGMQGRIDVASAAVGAVAVGLMSRATLLPNHGGAALVILGGGSALRSDSDGAVSPLRRVVLLRLERRRGASARSRLPATTEASEPDDVPVIPDARYASRCVKTGTALITLSLLGLMNWYHPTIRFSSSDANRIAPLVLNLLPWVGGVTIASQLRRWRLVGYVTLMFPLLFFSGCFALFSLINLPETAGAEDIDVDFRPVERFVLTHSTLMLYRTNCGAVCRPGLVFRQERRLIPGLMLVREIGAWPDASEAWIYHAAPNEWCVQIDGSVSSPGRHFTLHLDDHW